MRAVVILIGLAVAGLVTSPADAASPIGNVGTAKADQGALSAEGRLGGTFDGEDDGNDRRFRVRQHVDYGLADWYAARLVLEQNRTSGEALEFTSITFENRIQLIEKRDAGFDGGIRIIYGHRPDDDTPDEVDVRLMGMGPIGDRWAWRHNTVLEHDIGDKARDGVALELRSQVTRTLDVERPGLKKISAGVEMFNDFGRLRETSGFSRQDHQIGPVVKADFDNGLYAQGGYRAGVSDDAPDHLLKLFIGFRL